MMLIMLGGPGPMPGEGRLWQAVDGEPAFRRIAHVDAAPDVDGTDVEVWVGELRFPEVGEPPPPSAGGLLVFSQEPRPGDEEEFDAFMDTDHVPALAGVDGVLLAQRYVATQGTPRFTAVYYVTEPGVCTSDEWRSASRTAWRERMSARNLNRRRGLYVPAS
jgi:hypothetical protein